ncbi:MAG: quinoprotein glucose dehydrogenase [Paracoccaceae bacterium]|jgi:quinoprotein glucose dehydrogenase
MTRALVLSLSALLPLHAQLVPSKLDPKITIPEGLTLSRFADQSQVQNATAICLDGQNRVYIAETNRWRVQVQDIRHGGKNGRYLRERVNGDISSMTLADRTAFHKEWSGKEPDYLKWEEFTKDSEVIKLLEDTNGDGVADKTTVFRGDFNDPLAGPSGGLIEKDGTVYFAMIPGVYSLKDTNNDGKAEEVKTLINGFGVRVSFSGHDLNGFAWGPDGKLYWSIGDRGYHIEQDGKTFSRPDSGGVFRANPDGTEFEEFYINLRNPKEIVFDEFGNLFTVDNDYDHGDRERIVYLIEDGDSGWKMGHQTIASFGGSAFTHMGGKPPRKEDQIDAWMNEGLWNTRHERQPAYINPPIAYSANGPCGLAYNPGITSLPAKFDRNFFFASYVAGPDRCLIERFTLDAEGATFKLGEQTNFLKGIALTDLDWGYDGKLYIADYGGGWTKSGKGNVYTLADTAKLGDPAIKEVKELFATGIPKLESDKLFALLDHPDQRVRQRAQFALADHGLKSLPHFEKAIKPDQPLMRRLHGLWGLGQLGQENPSALNSLTSLIGDKEMEVRANLARTLGNHGNHLAPFRKALIAMLEDPSSRVASLAAIALSNHGDKSAVEPALALVEKNNDDDVVIRHAGIMLLAKCADSATLAKLNSHPSTAVRRAAVVALRRQQSIFLESYFDDQDLHVRQEAIRAAYEMDVRETYPALSQRAYTISKRVTQEVKWHPLTARRAIHAAWTLGRDEDLAVLAGIVSDASLDFRVRKDALIALLDWNTPPVADPVTAFVRGLPTNRIKLTTTVLDQLTGLIDGADDNSLKLLPRLLTLVEQDKLTLDAGHLTRYLKNQEAPAEARVKALQLLAPLSKDDATWPATLETLFTDQSDQIRSQARELLFKTDPNRATAQLGNLLSSKEATLKEKQLTLQTLAKLKTPKAKEMIQGALNQLIARKAKSGIALDIVTAAEKSGLSLDKFRASLPKDDPNAEWNLLCRDGGDIKLGKKVLYEHGTAQCQRCHTMHGVGGDVGPELGAIGKDHDRAYLLRSLIDPGAEVAEGYGVGTITLKDGTSISGNFLPDDKDGNAVINFGEITKIIPQAKIASKSKAISAMPPMSAILTKQETRDLVAYLASCKKDKTDEGHK